MHADHRRCDSGDREPDVPGNGLFAFHLIQYYDVCSPRRRFMPTLRVTLVGCLMGIPALAATNSAAPTFNKDVLPILQANCQQCHRPGEIAPMSLLTYTEARPWAKAIKAVRREPEDAAMVCRPERGPFRQRPPAQRSADSRLWFRGSITELRKGTRRIVRRPGFSRRAGISSPTW